MILIYTGGLGSGKTVSIVRDMYEDFLKGNRTIMTNFNLNFKHLTLSTEMIKKYKEWKYDNLTIGIDEIHILVDSRTSMNKKNRVYGYWFTQTRKRNVDLYCTTQFPHQIDKRLRSVADYIINCQKIEVAPKKKNRKVNFYGSKKQINDVYIITHAFDRTNDRFLKKKIYYANPYFNLYDTYEVIDFNEYQEEENNIINDYSKLIKMSKQELIKIIRGK